MVGETPRRGIKIMFKVDEGRSASLAKINSPGKHITYVSQEECRGHERSADNLFDGYPERLSHFPRKEKTLDHIHDQKKRISSRRNDKGHVTAISFVIHQHAYKEDKRLIHLKKSCIR